jgi:hypothetical protein
MEWAVGDVNDSSDWNEKRSIAGLILKIVLAVSKVNFR